MNTQYLPEKLFVLNWLTLDITIIVFLPALDPFCDPFDGVLRVGPHLQLPATRR